MDDSRIKHGWQAASKIPSKVRTIIKPVKFLQAAWQAKTVPQAMILKLRYLAMGTLAMMKFWGYSTNRIAM